MALVISLVLVLVPGLLGTSAAFAHNVAAGNAAFIEGISGPAIAPFMYLGAKHMMTGYDHLLYLMGVVFYLTKPRDILLFITLFTLGHSITLLAGVIWSIRVNASMVDMIIGLSVVYKAFENLGGFRNLLPLAIDARWAVFAFGLCHGLGLATKLQQIALSEDGLTTNLLSFNLGVELGQGMALAGLILLLLLWRRSERFTRQAFIANTLLMTAGFCLAGYHLAALLLGETA